MAKEVSEKELNETITKIMDEAPKKETDYKEVSNRKKLELEGGVKERKKSLGSKFAETFLSEDINEATDYVKKDIIIPSLKNLLFDSITNTLQMVIFGGTVANRDPRRGGYRDYNSISKSSPYNNRSNNVNTDRDRFDFRDLSFSSRRDAEEVLYTLYEYIHDYGHATVADYYNLIPGVTSVYTDKDWGWKDLREAKVRPVRDGFIITLPRPIYRPEDR